METVSFCPHCGEDLRDLTAVQAEVVAAPPSPARAIVRREVTSTEVERIWGLAPLPFQMRPFGVIVEGQEQLPIALACENRDGQWECARGEIRMLSEPTAPVPAQQAPASYPGQAPLTVPSHPAPGPGNTTLHNCAPEGMGTREARGNGRYGTNA